MLLLEHYCRNEQCDLVVLVTTIYIHGAGIYASN